MNFKDFLKEFAKAFFIGILVFIVISIVEFANGYNVITDGNFWFKIGFNQLYSVVLYCNNMLFFRYLVDTHKQKLFELNNLSQGIFGGILITLASLVLLRFVTEVAYFKVNPADFLANEKMRYYYISFLVSAVVTSIFYGAYYYKYRQENRVKEQKIIAGTASAKFDALKNQLDPHFLFNSLNVLTSLIEENPAAATKFTTALSKVYRYVLEQKNKELVSVIEELQFAELYMSLLKMRFEDSIVFTFPKTLENPEAKVVPLSLQLLLENAVKHNQVTENKKLYISITEEAGNLIITNNLQPKQSLKESTGVGLQNITSRYRLLTNKPVTVKEDSKNFMVSIPLLTENIVFENTPDTYISEKKYKMAKARVERIMGFYIHFAFYIIMVPVFLYLNYISNAGFPWAIFPIGGWGFGVLSHAAEAFEYNPFFGKKWEDRKIQEMMNKEKRKF